MTTSRQRVDIINVLGLHLRASDQFVRTARQFQAEVKVIRGDRTANGRSILDLTTLGAACGADVVIEADGPDAELALEALVSLVGRGFDEPDLKTTLFTSPGEVPVSSQQPTAPMAGQPAAAGERPSDSTLGTPILIVEDDVDTAETMARLLTMCGHIVQIARNGYQAIELAHRQPPGYVLLDLGLPGLDGYAVAARLRSELAGPFTIIAVTGHGQEEDRLRACEAGINYHLLKPADPSAVLSLLTPQPD